MPRLSIDITVEQHTRLKAMATLNGQTIKAFVLSRVLHGVPDIEAMKGTAEASQQGGTNSAAPPDSDPLGYLRNREKERS